MLEKQYDFIVVGSGSAGSAIAARLTESGQHRVLLLEAGNDDRWHWIRIPSGVAKIFVGDRSLWRFETEPNAGLGGRRLFFPRGKILGGTSNVNGMFWVRGNPAEFDHWRDLGNRGWGYQDVQPYFKRMETFTKGDPAVRGHSGPLVITEYSPRDPLTDAFLNACSEFGIPENADYNGTHYGGAGLMQLSTSKGLRWSVREGYLHPAMKRSNLTVLTDATVLKVRIECGRATGIDYQMDGQRFTALATREVVLSAGTVHSPQILELSGIGNESVLRRQGIAVTKHLPGVGENLRDHLHARLMVKVRGLDTLNNLLSSPWGRFKMGLRYALFRDGLVSVPGATAHAFSKTEPSLAQPNIKLQLHHLSSPNERDPKKLVLDSFPGFSIGIVHQQPKSRGSIHVQSTSPFDAPRITTNYLSESEDLQAYVQGFRLARRIISQPAFARYQPEEVRPGQAVHSDDEVAQFLRENLFSSYHPVGTCRMGQDDGAVVDDELRVHGIGSLRVADASIMPTIPSANTNAASIMVGEKAADMLLHAARSA